MASDAETNARPVAVDEEVEANRALLGSVSDEMLRNQILSNVLGLEPGWSLTVMVCPIMHMSDSFQSFNIDEAVKLQYVEANLQRKRRRPPLFVLACPSEPANDATYDGGDCVQDKLIEYFNKNLIRFNDEQPAADIEAPRNIPEVSDTRRFCHARIL